MINKNLICNIISDDYSYTFKRLNELDGVEGFIYKNYSPAGGRKYFTEQNAKKIDAIRIAIEKIIEKDLYYHLLASLLESADKVANTASVYGAYLKEFKKSALKKMKLIPANYKEGNVGEVYCRDANQLINLIYGDILYLDPPYNARQYGANYHLLNTIALYKEFEPRGITGLPEYDKSLYCKKSSVYGELDDLIKNASFEYIFLSYNNEGLLSMKDIKDIFSKYGEYKLFHTDYRRYKADNKREYSASHTIEYLHFLQK